jgi:hypothetical protein
VEPVSRMVWDGEAGDGKKVSFLLTFNHEACYVWER